MDDNDQTPHYMSGSYRAHYNRIYTNGDFHNPGKRVLFNRKYFPTLFRYMDHLTDQDMGPNCGRVRGLFTPSGGHRVRSLEDLRPDGVYVAVGSEKIFKEYGYEQIDPYRKKSPTRANEFPEPIIRKNLVSGKVKKMDTQGIMFRCSVNGDGLKGSYVVVFTARNRPQNMVEALILISNVMACRCGGPVDKLYMPNGVKVMSLDMIAPNRLYVAVKMGDRFRSGPYYEFPQKGLSFAQLDKNRLPPLPYSNKTSSHSSPDHSMTSRNGSDDINSYSERSHNKPFRREREQARRKEDQPFTAPAKPRQRRHQQVDYDQDNSGVFKSKSQNRATRGAQEVDESRYTRTEVPVDQREAEIVQDEELNGDTPRNGWKERRSRERRDRGRKDEEPDRTHRPNARRAANSPSSEQARREKEKEAQSRREAENRARVEQQRQQQEALKRKKKEREEERKRQEEEEKQRKEEERRKREEEKQKKEEEKRRKEEEREQERRRREEEKERQREEEEERRRREEEERAAAPRTSTPDRHQDSHEERRRSAHNSPIANNRPGTETLHDDQQEEWAATRIQAGFRGYRERRDLKQKKGREEEGGMGDGRDSRNEDPVPVQGEEDWGLAPVMDEDDDKDQQEKAATKIQAGFRGAKARREVNAMRAEKEMNDRRETTPPPASSPPPRPASKDPSQTRTVSPMNAPRSDNDAPLSVDNDQNDISQEDAEHAAATKIQAAFRGQQTRKELAGAREREGGERSSSRH